MEEKIRCAYCGEEKLKSEMKQSKLVYRTSKNGRACIESVLKWYCQNKDCAGNDQMAHEG